MKSFSYVPLTTPCGLQKNAKKKGQEQLILGTIQINEGKLLIIEKKMFLFFPIIMCVCIFSSITAVEEPKDHFDCECIKWDQCSWFNDAFKRALEISKGIYQGVLSTGMVQPNLWYKSL